MMLLAIDPGPVRTALVRFNGKYVFDPEILPNHEALGEVMAWPSAVAIENIEYSYGNVVGKDVCTTIRWIGRYQQAAKKPESVQFVTRKEVVMHLCDNTKVGDSAVRQALIDRFEPLGGGKTPQIGVKSSPGPLFGVAKDMWAALGVAVTVWETRVNA